MIGLSTSGELVCQAPSWDRGPAGVGARKPPTVDLNENLRCCLAVLLDEGNCPGKVSPHLHISPGSCDCLALLLPIKLHSYSPNACPCLMYRHRIFDAGRRRHNFKVLLGQSRLLLGRQFLHNFTDSLFC